MVNLKIGGFTPLSMSDYPGQISAVIFCQGCPWRCRYCHNPHLIPNKRIGEVSFDEVMKFLKKRVGLLDAVVLSGGEPTMQVEVVDAAMTIKSLGFKVALHTCGQYPRVLKKLLPHLSWVGIDIKAPFKKYELITRRKVSPDPILESMKAILDSTAKYEFRTTVHQNLLSTDDVLQIANVLKLLGAKKYVLQNFRREGCINQELCESYSDLAKFNEPQFKGLFEIREFSDNMEAL